MPNADAMRLTNEAVWGTRPSLREILDECTPTSTDRNLSATPAPPRIPNVYKRWQTTAETPPEILPPEVLDNPDTRVKLIFRSGEQPNSAVLGRQYFWGYTGGSHDIVAYRVIKLE